MALDYQNLDDATRQLMLSELELDLSHGTLYISPRLNEAGVQNYESLLREAILRHDDEWLAAELRSRDYINTNEERPIPQGGLATTKVPATAPDTLAEGEFNRFYVRGLCSRALNEGIPEVVVYRGKQVQQPRPASEAMIGKRIPAMNLLLDLRQSPGVEPALGLPPGPDSGLTVRLPVNTPIKF